MTPLRAGIVGGGWIARVHVPAIDAADGVELVAACDIDRAKAEAIAGPRGAQAYERWEEMLERERLDVLWVCTPPLHHRDPVLAALAAGIHVYLEKPIARTMDDAEAIVAAAGAGPGICVVGYQWHATELLDDVRAALAGQRVGMLVGRNYGPVAGRPWFMDQAQGGGQILERGSHHIDLQRAIAGEIAAVEATAGSVRLARPDVAASIDDSISLVFHFATARWAAVHSVWSRDGQPELYATDVLAEEATLALELGPEAYRLTGTSRGERLATEYGEPMLRSIDRFLEVVRSGDTSRIFCPPADAIRTLAVALACERAIETRAAGGAVRLRRIDHVGIVVADLDAHVAQLEALGLSLGRSSDGAESHAEYYPCGDASVELIDVRDADARARRLPAGEQARIEHIAFEVDSPLEEIRDGLEARGVEVSWPPWPSGDARDDLDDGRDQRRRPVPVHAPSGEAVRVALIGAGAIAQRHVAVLERRDGVERCRGVRHRCGARVAARRPAPGRPPTPTGRRCSTARRWTPCSSARRRACTRRRRSPRSSGAWPSIWRSRWPATPTTARRSWTRGGAAAPCAASATSGGAWTWWRSFARCSPGQRPGMLVSRSFGHTESGRGDLHTESWFTDQRRSGGILYELGSHDVDLQIAIAGPVEWVQGTASTGTLALAGVDGARLDDAVSVVMRFASGGIGSLHVAWTEVQDPAVYSLDVQAPDAALLLQSRSGVPPDRAGRGAGGRQHRRGRSARVVGRSGSSRRRARAIRRWCRAPLRTRWTRCARCWPASARSRPASAFRSDREIRVAFPLTLI